MKRIRIFLLGILFCVVADRGYAQDIRKDMLNMYASYNNLQWFSSVIQVDIYKDMDDTKPYLSKTGEIKKSGNLYYSFFDNNYVLNNKKYLVYVSSRDKLIYYREHSQKVPGKFKPQFEYNEVKNIIDTALLRSDSIQFMGIKNGQKQYVIRSNRSLMQVIDLYMDEKSGLITRMVYYYNKDVMKENNKVAIRFTNINYSSPLGNSVFSESQFFVNNGKEFVPAGKFSGFEVFNDSQFNQEEDE